MEKKEVCWNVTTRCNQCCRYCHRFLNICDLKKEDNFKILDNLIESGINEITWTGGEALLLDGIDELIMKSYKSGIKNKIITNGKLLTIDRLEKLRDYLDSITLSIDSIDNDINEKLGRGFNHYSNIDNILNYLKENNIKTKLRINTVVNKLNLCNISSLVEYLNRFDIYSWRIFKFMPLRETAIKNQEDFDVTNKEFDDIVFYAKKKSNIKNIESRVREDMQKKYLLILADGSIVVTDKTGDRKLGNALNDSIKQFM
jgi:MoaA/NifB/PqqE/SkfB family radical SAM enzyme